MLSANKGRLKKAEHNLTTYSGHHELAQKNNISKVHFFVGHPVDKTKPSIQKLFILISRPQKQFKILTLLVLGPI